jgi:predicted dehydrogenase
MMSVRIGFIGTGGIAQTHMRGLLRIETADVVAMYDVARERAEAAARQFPACRVYDSYQRMLDEGRLDAVYVCLPPFAHERQEIDAATAGLALFVEKPIATTTEKAIEIYEAITAAGVISAVGYNWRWLDTTDRAKAITASTRFAMALGYWMGGMPGVDWWRRKQGSGGQAVEQTTHIFDLARYLLGEVTEVYALGFSGLRRDIPGYDIEDTTTVNLQFASGTIGNISSADLLPPGADKVGIDLIGRDIRLEQGSRTLTVYGSNEHTTYTATVDPYFLEDAAFVKAVAGKDGSHLRCDYREALRTHFVTMAVNRSLESHRIEAVRQLP